MSRARAPGKVVVSGAYAVLEGAPAIVAAVDRYVVADASRAPEFVTPEVREALGNETVPWFDASALRQDGQKLGLGSSAAILVASLAARELLANEGASDSDLTEVVFRRAVAAHARAQGGGSGIDVAASAFGGVIAAQRTNDTLEVQPFAFPAGLSVEVWAAGRPASTPELVGRVRKLRNTEPARWQAMMDPLRDAARAASASTTSTAFVDALRRQAELLHALGEAADAGIVTPELVDLGARAKGEDGVFMPSGAGGGDIAIFAADHPPSKSLASLAIELGLTRLDLTVGARGVHAAS